MTMEEIDALRTELGEKRKIVDRLEADSWAAGSPIVEGSEIRSAIGVARYAEVCAERNVEAALREWWAQDCKDPTTVNGEK
jgi:hypothetical protein